MKPSCDELRRALHDPAAMLEFSEATWDRVARQAASAGLLGRLGALAHEAEIDSQLPAAVQRQMEASLTIAAQQERAVRFELVELARALADLPGPVLLLKGAAYVAAKLPPARGRHFADIDCLVPHKQIGRAEAALMLDGWATGAMTAYDQRYYRVWMHELPPMTHIRRQTVLDVHHRILPPTARIQTPPEPLIECAQALPEFPRFSIPEPADLVLHGACHLFHEGEWQHGLRNLVDLDALLNEFGRDSGFWERLLVRAEVLQLGRPLFYGLRYSRQLLGTPVPQWVTDRCPGQPSRALMRIMDHLFLPAFASAHASCRSATTGLTEFVLYLRSHWLRMPMRLLIPHLLRKAWESVAARFESAKAKDT